jgi:hypothetical protein
MKTLFYLFTLAIVAVLSLTCSGLAQAHGRKANTADAVERLPFFNPGSEQGRCKSPALFIGALN